MPFKELMNWDANKSRWHKYYKGNMYRVVPSILDADDSLPKVHICTRDGSRAAANVWWERKQSEIDGVPPRNPVAEAARERQQFIEKLKVERISDLVDAALSREREEGITATKLVAAVREAVSGPTKAEHKLKALVTRFLEVVQGEMKPLSFRELRDYLRSLVAGRGEADDVSAWEEDTVERTYFALKNADLSSGTKNKRWGFFKRFVKHCASKRVCPLPLNLDQYGFTVEAKAVKTYATGEVKALLKSLPSRFRLYAYLGMNCGMTSADMGCLTKGMVDLDGGKLTRRRVKTNENLNVPTVTYALWPETLALLVEHWSDDPAFVLTSVDGTVMWSASQDGDKTPVKDLIGQQWRRRKIKVPLKSFRSIGATMLESHKDYGRCALLYLAHSPKSVKDRHYAAPPAELFFEAVGWLGQQFRSQEGV